MGTAVKVMEDVGGFIAPATLYLVDPPIKGTDHLVVYYQPPISGQEGRVCVLLATANGADFTRSRDPQRGTYVTNDPDFALALQIAGYEIVEGV